MRGVTGKGSGRVCGLVCVKGSALSQDLGKMVNYCRRSTSSPQLFIACSYLLKANRSYLLAIHLFSFKSKCEHRSFFDA